MDGPSVTLTPEQATPDNAVAACAEVCRTARRPGPDGYPFMGLQWNNMCFCGDTYDKEDGTGRLDVSECDSNGDMVPDCGQSMVGTDPNPNACVWRNGTIARTFSVCCASVSLIWKASPISQPSST